MNVMKLKDNKIYWICYQYMEKKNNIFYSKLIQK